MPVHPSVRVLAASLLLAGVCAQADELTPYRERDVFALARGPSPRSHFLRGYLAAAFNDGDAAVRELTAALKEPSATPELTRSALLLLADVRMRQNRYADQAAYLGQLLAAPNLTLSADERRDIEQTLAVASGLRTVPAQTVSAHGPATLTLERDRIGLARIAVSVNGEATRAVFDTGANYSTASRSFAREHRLELLPATVTVQAATGNTVQAQLAVADALTVGRTALRHVVFLVFADKDLAFPSIHYAIDAIVGWPVIATLGRMRFQPSGQLEVDLPSRNVRTHDLAMDGLTPLIAITVDGHPFPFVLDTGANASSCTEALVKRVPALAATIQAGHAHSSGAGGHVTSAGDEIAALQVSVAGTPVTLAHASVTPHSADPASALYGRIGSDVLAGRAYELDLTHLDFHLLEAPTPPKVEASPRPLTPK